MIITKQYLKDIVYEVNGAAIEVHKSIGPGLLESVYHKCMKHELELRHVNFKSELSVSVNYKGFDVNADLRCDFYIENCLVVELKAIEKVLPIHVAQIITYMKILQAPMGLMINFNCTNIFNEGQKTYVNELYKNLED
jgi:GxxExxY protein